MFENNIHNNGQLVYHYTTIDTLMKILGDIDEDHLTFHASSMLTLNDSSEFYYGVKEFRRLLPNIENTIGHIDESIKLSKIFADQDKYYNGKFNKLFCELLMQFNKTPFIVSTSSLGDYIPMWSMYGDSGRGVSIGLDIANLYKKRSDNSGKLVLDYTDYNLNQPHPIKIRTQLSLNNPAIAIIKKEYKEYIQGVGNVTNSERETFYSKVLCSMSSSIAATIKHPAFSFENEWRILQYVADNKDVQYKSNSNGKITPYIKIKIPKKNLKKIIVGPKSNPQVKQILERMLYNHNQIHCKVKASRCPLI